MSDTLFKEIRYNPGDFKNHADVGRIGLLDVQMVLMGDGQQSIRNEPFLAVQRPFLEGLGRLGDQKLAGIAA